MGFKATVKYIGKEVQNFFNNDKLFIIYEDTPDVDIREYCIIIDLEKYDSAIDINSKLSFANQVFTILDVGSDVDKTLKQLSHATFRFGDNIEMLPGSIHLKEIPTCLPSIGSQIIID